MKNAAKLAVIGALLAMGVAQTNAATTATNWVSPVTFSLTVYTNGSAAPAYTIATKDAVTKLIGGGSATVMIPSSYSTNFSTNAGKVTKTINTNYTSTNITVTFGSKASLLVKNPGLTSQQFVIRDSVTIGKLVKTVDFDANSYFSYGSEGSVGTSTTKHEVLYFSYNRQLSSNKYDNLYMQGFATETKAAISATVSNVVTKTLTAPAVAGSGVVNLLSTNSFVLTGSLTIGGGKAE